MSETCQNQQRKMENQQAKDVTVAAFNLDTHTSKWGYPGRKSNTQVSVHTIES